MMNDDDYKTWFSFSTQRKEKSNIQKMKNCETGQVMMPPGVNSDIERPKVNFLKKEEDEYVSGLITKKRSQ